MYKIIKDTSIVDLEIKVSEYINAGWKPCGGISTYEISNGLIMYLQSVYQ